MNTNNETYTSRLDSISPKMMARIQALRLMDDDFMSVVLDGDTDISLIRCFALLNMTNVYKKIVYLLKNFS